MPAGTLPTATRIYNGALQYPQTSPTVNIGYGPNILVPRRTILPGWSVDNPPSVHPGRRKQTAQLLDLWIPPFPQTQIPLRSPFDAYLSRHITGITRDASGAPLAGCTVKAYNSATDAMVGSSVSDANGVYGIVVPQAGPYYLVAYKVNAPDVTGATVNTVMPT